MNRQDARMRKPYERIKWPSQKPLNTDTVRVRGSKYHRGDGQYKSNVNCRRINHEVLRHKLAVASFIPAAFLMKNGCCVMAVKL